MRKERKRILLQKQTRPQGRPPGVCPQSLMSRADANPAQSFQPHSQAIQEIREKEWGKEKEN